MSNFKGSAQRASRAARPLFARANYYGAHTASVEKRPLISQIKKKEEGESAGPGGEGGEGAKIRTAGAYDIGYAYTHTPSGVLITP